MNSNNPDNSYLVKKSKELRKNMTPQERRLWYCFFKKMKLSVKKQAIIGNYIVDFYIPREKIVVEIDGSQHFEEEGIEKDKIRDKYLTSKWLKILRYSNYEINTQFDSVCDDILLHFEKDTTFKSN